MTTFKVKEVNKDQNWIRIEVHFDDGERYEKRMMVHGFDEETIKGDVAKWLKYYEPIREKDRLEKEEQKKQKDISINKSFEAPVEHLNN